jgi:hypothetical protein
MKPIISPPAPAGDPGSGQHSSKKKPGRSTRFYRASFLILAMTFPIGHLFQTNFAIFSKLGLLKPVLEPVLEPTPR